MRKFRLPWHYPGKSRCCNEMMRNPKPSGFTLIEMIVTVALVAIIASVATPVIKMHLQRERERELKEALREIRTAIDAYKKAGDEGLISRSAESTGYPHALGELVMGSVNQRDPKGRKIYFLRRIPRDPMNLSSSVSSEDSWGKRTYASDADSPAEGDDVYDVYSLSDKTGTNGIPYRQW
jgi:general secretion pathway protein G